MFTKRRMFHVAVLSMEHFLVRGFDVNVQHILLQDEHHGATGLNHEAKTTYP